MNACICLPVHVCVGVCFHNEKESIPMVESKNVNL